jgi:iron only hydrogenase large subunit-like protein
LQLSEKIEKKADKPLFITACPAWVKYAEQFVPTLIPQFSTVKSPQQITGILIKTIVAGQLDVKPEQIFSVSVTPCMAMKYEARRDGMMRKGISDVDSVMTVRELAKLIRLNGIDFTNTEKEPADEPLSGRSSSAALAEVSGGMAESVIRLLYYRTTGKEIDKQTFKKFRLSGTFRESSMVLGDNEIRVAVVDGLTGLGKLRSAEASGTKYDLIEVMTCPGGCIHGGGLPFISSKEDLKNRSKLVYQSDENEAIALPCKSPSMINLYDRLLKENTEISDKSIFYTHFEKRNVLL